MKKCIKCGRLKDDSEYYKNKTYKDGLYSKCKDCVNKYFKEYRSSPEVKEKLAVYQKQWRKNNPEKWSAIVKKCEYRDKMRRKFIRDNMDALLKLGIEDYYGKELDWSQIEKSNLIKKGETK